MRNSRLRGLHRLDTKARIAALEAAGFLDEAHADDLRSGRHILPVLAADAMIENAIGVFGLPLGIAPNFRVDGRDCLVPLVVEEPSVVAALSGAARLIRRTGGFVTERPESLLTGQVHLAGVRDPDSATAGIHAHRERLIATGNAALRRLVARGGGLREIDVRHIELDDGERVLAVHLQVDTREAMGANLVNTLCESLAPALEALTGGHAALRILSNLADRALVVARARVALGDLGDTPEAAARARDGIVLANRIACADPYRATTHNKGIMNGIDPLAVATGNDWRAIEAGAHAYAARQGRYVALTTWREAENGDLEGSLALPLKPGTVGGTLANNPAADLCLRLTGARSADELARLMAAVGLAQNFAALRALATVGIQAGHMRLHGRSVAAVKARDSEGPRRAIDTGGEARTRPVGGKACGKAILFGEHAVVYGRHALAVPIHAAVSASAWPSDDAIVEIADWRLHERLADGAASPLSGMIVTIARELGIPANRHSVSVATRLPRAMGLGSSAAIAVAVTRALASAAGIALDDARTNDIAFECEKLAHGTPSGVDNSLATFGRPLLYRREGTPPLVTVNLPPDLPLVIACGHHAGHTREQVAAVRSRRAGDTPRYERLFDEMEALCLDGRQALEASDFESAGDLMNIAHGLLNAIGVSTPELERMVRIAREAGAAGAKLTGAGGGGSIVALCPGSESTVLAAFDAAGFRTIDLGGSPRPRRQGQDTI